jgi:DNA-binding transcriptional LysR family regulator
MDSTALRYFSAVARLGSVQAAGQALNVAGSAISRQIAGLEQLVGTPLFERHARGMRATPAGEILANHARWQELESERVAADIRRLSGHESAVLRIDTVEGMAQYVIPEAIARLHRLHPGMQVLVSVPGTHRVSQRVRSGEADIGLTFALAPEPEIRVIRRLDGAILAFAVPEHPLAQRNDDIAISDLAGVPIFLMNQDTTVRQLFDMACAQEGIVIRPVVIANSSAVIRHMTLSGQGVSVASYLTMARHVCSGQLVALRIAHPILEQRSLQVQVLAGRQLPAGIDTFLACLDAVIAEFGSSRLQTDIAPDKDNGHDAFEGYRAPDRDHGRAASS